MNGISKVNLFATYRGDKEDFEAVVLGLRSTGEAADRRLAKVIEKAMARQAPITEHIRVIHPEWYEGYDFDISVRGSSVNRMDKAIRKYLPETR